MIPVRRETRGLFHCLLEPSRCGAVPAGQDAFDRALADADDEILTLEAEGHSILIAGPNAPDTTVHPRS